MGRNMERNRGGAHRSFLDEGRKSQSSSKVPCQELKSSGLCRALRDHRKCGKRRWSNKVQQEPLLLDV